MAHKSSSNHESTPLLERCAVVVLGLYLIAVGLHAISASQLLYRNYLHSPVLAPVTIVIGVALIVAGVGMRY